MATQVLDWGREHDPSASYVKKWLPNLASLPPALAREPWCMSEGGCADFVDGGSAWACPTCTLENHSARRRCEACGSPRPPLHHAEGGGGASALGVYSHSPIVPPPPDSMSSEDICQQCGNVDFGCVSEDGAFYCEECWQSFMEGVPEQSPTMPPTPAELDLARGWKLLDSVALPRAGDALADSPVVNKLNSPQQQSSFYAQDKGCRWKVKKERSSASDIAAGG